MSTINLKAVGQNNGEQVSRELDSLKRRGGEVEAAARLATKWLLQAIQAGQPSGSLRAQVRAVKLRLRSFIYLSYCSIQLKAHQHYHRLKGNMQQMYRSRMQMILVGFRFVAFISIPLFSHLIYF